MPLPTTKTVADTVLMVRPVDFSYNEETAADNEFQRRPADEHTLLQTVLGEFDRAVSALRDAGIEVLILEKRPHSARIPDAVFPNNWISTEPNGTVFLYPMCAPSRRVERSQYHDVEKLIQASGFQVRSLVSVGPADEASRFLEGTGSMCLDRRRCMVYAALSQRTHVDQLDNFLRLSGYRRVVTFHTRSSRGIEFYHTNVMLCVGDTFAVVCPECISVDAERAFVLRELAADREVIEISLKQTEEYFCANCIQLQTRNGDKVIVASRRAFEGYTPDQRRRLEAHGKPVVLSIDQIEEVGGGSARCMLAEVFLPRMQV